MSWQVLNFVTLIVYLLFMLYLGLWSERGISKTANGFLLAERSATLPWIIMSVFATGIGTLAYIGTVGMISKGGVIDLWFEFFWCIGTPLMTLLFVRKLRTSGIISFLDSIAFRFGPQTLLILVLFLLIAVPFSFAQMLKGAGLTFTDMFPSLKEIKVMDPLAVGALIVLIVIALYLAVGGFKACLVTDMLQGIFTWAAMIVPLIAVFYIMGDKSFSKGWEKIVNFYKNPPESSILVQPSDIDYPIKFIKKIKEGKREIDKFVNSYLSKQTLEVYKKLTDIKELRKLKKEERVILLKKLKKYLVNDLNSIIKGELIYTPERFKDIELLKEQEKAINSNPKGKNLLILNRSLLEKAYPKLILQHPNINYLKFDKVIGPTAPDPTYSYSFITAMLIMNVLIIMLPGQFYGSRYMAAKTEKIARQGPILALILTTVPYGLLVNLTGIAFKAYAPEIPGDDLFTGVLRKLAQSGLFPQLISSLLLISLLAAVMGTLDSYLMAKMTDFVRGIYHLWINPKAKDEDLVRVSRFIIFLLVVVAIIATFYMPPSIWFLQIAVTAFIGPISFVLIIGAFHVKRATWQGAVAGGVISSLIALFFTAALTGFNGQYPGLIIKPLKEIWPDWLHHQFFTYPIGIIIFLIVNKFVSPQRPEHLERFFSTKETLEYVKKYGFDKPYVVIPKGADVESLLPNNNFSIKRYVNETRIYSDSEEELKRFAEKNNFKFYPAYKQFETWKEVFDERLKGLYHLGLEVAKQREIDKIGYHERKEAKILGGLMMALSIGIYLLMFWYFPLKWDISIILYIIGSVLMFMSLCIFYEDYEWARRIVDLISKEERKEIAES